MFPDGNTVTLLAIAIVNAITAFLAWKTHVAVTQAQKDIAIVEKATNSMKDALVASTAKASQASGDAKGRKDLLAEQKTERDERPNG